MIKIGVVGVGYWGPNLVRTLREIDDVQVIRVADLQAGRREFISRRFPNIETTAAVEDVIGDESIDAVFIATPPATHYPLAVEALNAGKHVFVEKPFTTDLAQAEELVRLAADKYKKLGVGHLFLYHPAVALINGLLANGELGTPLYICSSRFNVGPPQTKVDVLWDLAPHDIAVILHLFGEALAEVTASGAKFTNSDFVETAYLNLSFPSGRIAQINVGWLTPNKVRNLMMVCADKTVVYDDTQPVEKVRICDAACDNRTDQSEASKALAYRPGAICIPAIPNAEPLRVECTDFLNSIRTGSDPLSSGRRAVDVVRVLQAASESIYANKTARLEVARV